MAKSTILLSCLLLVLFNGCMGRDKFSPFQGNECQIDRLTALEPTNKIRAEAGLTEVWDNQEQCFQCAGVSVLKRTIEPNGLLLPSFTSGVELIYIENGNGIMGTMIPGCPETYESGSQEFGEQQSMQRGFQGGQYQDQHQKIRHLRQGDTVTLPAGVAHWAFNNGNEPLVAVVLIDTSNEANQLDKDVPKRFYLAGSPEQEHKQSQSQSQSQSHRGKQSQGNIFSGFDTRIIAESFGVSQELAQKLQAERDDRGNIVRVQEGLHVIKPPSWSQDEREQSRGSRGSQYDERQQSRHGSGGSQYNGIEETICSARLSENLDDPSRADIYTPEAGRLTTLNSYNLPILSYLRLSAAKGVLYSNAIMAPHYNLNAHNIMYCTQGRARIQIVNDQGNTVFDDELRQGQLVVVPQNFAIVKQASDEGFEWISFKTSEDAMFQSLAGRTSAMRAMPVEVIQNSFQISREEAMRLKFSQPQTTFFRPSRQGYQQRPLAA